MSSRLTISNPIRKHLDDMGNLTIHVNAGIKRIFASSVTAVPWHARRKSIGPRAVVFEHPYWQATENRTSAASSQAPPARNGVFHDSSRVRLTDIKNGLSNTFL